MKLFYMTNAILTEMPLKHYQVGDVDNSQFNSKKRDGRQIKLGNLYKGLALKQKLSDVLSRLTNHDIIIFVGQNHEAADRHTLAKMTGLSLEYFENAITLLITSINKQIHITPWLALHQFAEAMFNIDNYGRPWQKMCKRYKKHLIKVPALDPVKFPDDDTSYDIRAFHYLLKMKSARELLYGGFDNIDPDQEIVTEYLWHGGRIRMNYPDWIDHRVVDAMNKEMCEMIETELNSLHGKIINNII